MTDTVLVDSINYVDESARGKIVVSGSHGGTYAAYKAAASSARAVILNDAGVGFQNAGVACLEYCERIGMAAVVLAHSSARIGDSEDMFERGIVSGVNKTAEEAGCREGMTCEEAVNALGVVAPSHAKPPAYEETRFVLSDASPGLSA